MLLHPSAGDTVGVVASAGDAVAVVAPTDDGDAVAASAGDVGTRRTRGEGGRSCCCNIEAKNRTQNSFCLHPHLNAYFGAAARMYLGAAARPRPVRVSLNAPHRTLSMEARFNDHAPRRASSPWFRSPFPASHERQGTRVINPVQSGVYTHSYVVRHDFASSRARRTMTQPIQGPVAANTLVWPPRAALCGRRVPRGRP